MSISTHSCCSPLQESDLSLNYEIDLSYNLSIIKSSSAEKTESQSSQCSPLIFDYKDPICCICGSGNLVISCQRTDCTFKIHSHCLSYYFPELEGSKKICPSHSFKHLDECSKLVFLSDNFNLNSIIPSLMNTENQVDKEKDLNGALFWFAINKQYFPYFQIKKPSFSETPEKILRQGESTWISQEILNTEVKLENTYENILKIINCIQKSSNNCSKNPKAGENLENSHRFNLSLLRKFIRKYEETQKTVCESSHCVQDGCDFLLANAFICSVCRISDCNIRNPLLTCTNCFMQVHLLCYNTSQPFNSNWLCDPCKYDPTSEQLCCLCSNKRGALKFITPGKWAHLTCARYLQKCFLNDEELDLTKIDKELFKLKCFSCGVKVGACVQCCFGRCANAFHVECRKDLFEVGGYWLCPSHKASKLTRAVKAKQDIQLEFIKNIALRFWSLMNGEQKQAKRKYTRVKRKKDTRNSKFIVDIDEDKVLLKVLVNNKITKVIKYFRNGSISKCLEFPQSNSTEKEGEVKRISGLPMKRKPVKDHENLSCFKLDKSEFRVKVKIPKESIEKF